MRLPGLPEGTSPASWAITLCFLLFVLSLFFLLSSAQNDLRRSGSQGNTNEQDFKENQYYQNIGH